MIRADVRFPRDYIQPRPCQLPPLHGVHQILTINHRSPRRINDIRILLHFSQKLLINKVERLGRERTSDNKEIGFSGQFVQRSRGANFNGRGGEEVEVVFGGGEGDTGLGGGVEGAGDTEGEETLEGCLADFTEA